MGRVQGGARAAFATPSWGPARMTYYFAVQNEFLVEITKFPFSKFAITFSSEYGQWCSNFA